MKAVWISTTDRILKDFPVPAPAANEVLIKSEWSPEETRSSQANPRLLADVAVASNPKDWKLPYCSSCPTNTLGVADAIDADLAPYSAVEGNDVAGYIESVGEGALRSSQGRSETDLASGVTDFKKGDKVAAFTKMKTADKYGAYAEYSVRFFPIPHLNASSHFLAGFSREHRLPPRPQDLFRRSVSFSSPSLHAVLTKRADAATLPLAYMTAAIGLFLRLGLPTPLAPSTASPKLPVLIYGASTTVGVYAIQLAKVRPYHLSHKALLNALRSSQDSTS